MSSYSPFPFVFLCLVVATPSYGQQPAVRAGSADHARINFDIQRRAIEHQQLWESSKKITRLPVSQLPKEVKQARVSNQLETSSLSVGAVGRLGLYIYEIMSVVDDQNLIIATKRGEPIWLTDYDTSGLYDGQTVFVYDYVRVRMPKYYNTTNGGKRTVACIELLTQAETERMLEADKKKIEDLSPGPSPASTEPHQWFLTDGSSVKAAFVEVKNSKLYLRDAGGHVKSISLTKLKSNSKRLAVELQKNKKQESEDSKDDSDSTKSSSAIKTLQAKVWLNHTYKTVVIWGNEGYWVEKDQDGEKVHSRSRTIEVGEGFLEIEDIPSRKIRRIYATEMQEFKDGVWIVVAHGKWQADSKISPFTKDDLNTDKNSQNSFPGNDQRLPAPDVEVVSVALRDVQGPNGRIFKAVYVMVRNNSKKEIRIIDGIYHFYDTTGAKIEDVPYTLLALSNDEPGLVHGGERECGGFRIPIPTSVDSAKVTITKVLTEGLESIVYNYRNNENAHLTTQQDINSTDERSGRRVKEIDGRCWICLTNHFQLLETMNGHWLEVGMLGEPRSAYFKLVSSSDEFFEFENLKTKQRRRIFPDRFEDQEDGQWIKRGSGKWRKEMTVQTASGYTSEVPEGSAFTDQTYGGDFVKEATRWVKYTGDGKPLLEFVEISKSGDGLDLYCDARQQVFRIREDHVVLVEGVKQEFLLHGNWKNLPYSASRISKRSLAEAIMPDSSAVPSMQTAPATANTAKNPMALIVQGDNWIGTISRQTYTDLTRYAVQGDQDAFVKAASRGLINGNITHFKAGEELFLVKMEIFTGLMKVRRKGDTAEYWTSVETAK